jgi:hypothetical protein
MLSLGRSPSPPIESMLSNPLSFVHIPELSLRPTTPDHDLPEATIAMPPVRPAHEQVPPMSLDVLTMLDDDSFDPGTYAEFLNEELGITAL